MQVQARLASITRGSRVGGLLPERRGWPQRALYAALSIPLAGIYVALFVGLIASVGFSVQGVGVVLFVALLAGARGLGGFERRLARRLLGLELAPDVRLREERGWVRRVKRLVLESSTWRTLGWLGARVLLGAGIVASLLFGIGSALLLLAQLPELRWAILPVLVLVAVILFATVVALDLQVRLSAAAAPRLLGTASEAKIAALRQTSQGLAHRNRIARDLHDTIGHSLTASLLQATAARHTLERRPADPTQPVGTEFARQALEHIETNTRTALAELDRALAVLREEDAGEAETVALADAPDLGDLDALLDRLRDGGLPVTLTLAVAPDDVPRRTSQLGYRVVQEGTTNVLRHAGCTPTTVEVSDNGEALIVRVRNEPPAEPRPHAAPGGGRGLVGLGDRVAAVGGHFSSGSTPAGGFELRASVPMGARP